LAVRLHKLKDFSACGHMQGGGQNMSFDESMIFGCSKQLLIPR